MLLYNEIEESPDSYLLWKNPDLPTAGMLPFKDIYILWGQAAPNRLKIKALIYPRDLYDRAAVEKIAWDTYNCPFCREGKELTDLDPGALSAYLRTEPKPALSDWDRFWAKVAHDLKQFLGLSP